MKPLAVTAESSRRVADAVARGFHDNEMWCWIAPDPRRRERLLRRYYRAMVRHVHAPAGHAWSTPDFAGGALWVAPGESKLAPRRVACELAALISALGPSGMRRAVAINDEKKRHEPGEPHWYLETLSVEPARQRSGVGTALIAPVLDRCDRVRVPAYLETQRESNIPFYERFGFELTGEISARDSPPLWLMWREPRA